MQGATALETFKQTYGRGGQTNKLVDTGGVYRFENCGALKQLNFYATNLGDINFPPNGFTNTNLTYLELRYTSIKGGVEGDESEVIKQNTFSSCPNIENIYIDSGNLLAQEINFNAFFILELSLMNGIFFPVSIKSSTVFNLDPKLPDG